MNKEQFTEWYNSHPKFRLGATEEWFELCEYAEVDADDLMSWLVEHKDEVLRFLLSQTP